MTARQLTGWGESKAGAAPAQNRTLRLFAETARHHPRQKKDLTNRKSMLQW